MQHIKLVCAQGGFKTQSKLALYKCSLLLLLLLLLVNIYMYYSSMVKRNL